MSKQSKTEASHHTQLQHRLVLHYRKLRYQVPNDVADIQFSAVCKKINSRLQMFCFFNLILFYCLNFTDLGKLKSIYKNYKIILLN